MTRRPLRILALTITDATEGCTFARLITPLQTLKAQGKVEYELRSFSPTRAASFRSTLRELSYWDVIWVQRPHHYSALLFMREAQRLGKPVLVDADDWILDLPLVAPDSALVTRSCRETIRLAFRAATAVSVSTQVIADRCAALGVEAHVLPNAIDCRKFTREPRSSNNDVCTIAFCGSISHHDDVRLIMPALRALLVKASNRVRVVSVGCPLPELQGFQGYTHHAQVAATEYPRLLSQLRVDIGLAPLYDNAFTRAKSDIKYLEYSATGAATIASRVVPYAASICADRGVTVDANTPEAWSLAIQQMTDGVPARQDMAANAYAWVQKERSVAVMADRWYMLFQHYADAYHTSGVPYGQCLGSTSSKHALANIILHELPHDAMQVRRVVAQRTRFGATIWNGASGT